VTKQEAAEIVAYWAEKFQREWFEMGCPDMYPDDFVCPDVGELFDALDAYIKLH